jgi:hypothetical protein
MPYQALDPPFDVAVPGIRHLLADRNGVDVRRHRRVRQPDAGAARAGAQGLEEAMHAGLVALAQHVVERLEPFASLDGLEIRGIGRRDVLHDAGPLGTDNLPIVLLAGRPHTSIASIRAE